jgi:hypothetical protein
MRNEIPRVRPLRKSPRIVTCPRCGIDVEWRAENRYRPFCSERCKMIDLGAWASEAYRVPEQSADSDADRNETDREPPARPGT